MSRTEIVLIKSQITVFSEHTMLINTRSKVHSSELLGNNLVRV